MGAKYGRGYYVLRDVRGIVMAHKRFMGHVLEIASMVDIKPWSLWGIGFSWNVRDSLPTATNPGPAVSEGKGEYCF